MKINKVRFCTSFIFAFVCSLTILVGISMAIEKELEQRISPQSIDSIVYNFRSLKRSLFVRRIRKAFQNKDAIALSELIKYPVFIDNETIFNKEAFIDKLSYYNFFTEERVWNVTHEDVFYHNGDYALSSGLLWFNYFEDGFFWIFTIND